MEILSDDALCVVVNSYTTGLSASVVSNIMKMTIKRKFGGSVSADEIGLPIEGSDLVLPCGSTGRWEKV